MFADHCDIKDDKEKESGTSLDKTHFYHASSYLLFYIESIIQIFANIYTILDRL